jgi:predicted  nucleic acid-binding Zn-ribbon protein
MTWDGHLPHSGYELLGLIAVGVFALWGLQAGAGILIFRKHQTNDREARADREDLKADSKAIRAQVVNGHAADEEAPKLRDDMDHVKADLAEMKTRMSAWMDRWEPMIPVIRALTEDMRGFRADLSEERAARRELSKDIREDMTRHRDEVADMRSRYSDTPDTDQHRRSI